MPRDVQVRRLQSRADHRQQDGPPATAAVAPRRAPPCSAALRAPPLSCPAQVEKLLVFTITLTTPIVCAFACWASLNAQDFLNPLYPSALIFVIAFFIAESIATLFECTIDTIYVCSFRDAKEFGGKFMTDELRDAFGLDEAVAEKEATKTQVASEASERMKHASTGLQMNDSATLKGNAAI